MTSLILYTRTGCSLCQAMEAQLARLSPEGLFTLTTIDLENHPELESRYGEWVPVLMAGEDSGGELCHYHLDEAVLRGLARGATADVNSKFSRQGRFHGAIGGCFPAIMARFRTL